MRKLFSGLTLGLVLAAAAIVQAQSGFRMTGQTFGPSGGIETLQGTNVVIVFEPGSSQVQLRADKMARDPKTGDFLLEGNVRLSSTKK